MQMIAIVKVDLGLCVFDDIELRYKLKKDEKVGLLDTSGLGLGIQSTFTTPPYQYFITHPLHPFYNPLSTSYSLGLWHQYLVVYIILLWTFPLKHTCLSQCAGTAGPHTAIYSKMVTYSHSNV